MRREYVRVVLVGNGNDVRAATEAPMGNAAVLDVDEIVRGIDVHASIVMPFGDRGTYLPR